MRQCRHCVSVLEWGRSVVVPYWNGAGPSLCRVGMGQVRHYVVLKWGRAVTVPCWNGTGPSLCGIEMGQGRHCAVLEWDRAVIVLCWNGAGPSLCRVGMGQGRHCAVLEWDSAVTVPCWNGAAPSLCRVEMGQGRHCAVLEWGPCLGSTAALFPLTDLSVHSQHLLNRQPRTPLLSKHFAPLVCCPSLSLSPLKQRCEFTHHARFQGLPLTQL